MKLIEKIDQRKRRKYLNYNRRLVSDQSGFTLIEILVSIVILVLLFVPVLSGFMTSSKVNQKAKQTQKATILAQNMMESVKAMSLPELAIQFNGGGSFQVIKSNLDGYTGNYIMDNYAGNGFGEYIINNDNTFSRLTLASSPVSSVSKVEDTYTFDPPAGRKKFVFGIENLRDEKSAFDVVMQVDATRYSDNSKYTGTMNNFVMPNLLQLSEKEVALIDLEGASTIWSDDSESAVKVSNNSTDSQAMSDLYNMHLSYISYLNSIRGPKDPPVSSYYTEQNIRDKVIKNINIKITKDEPNKTIHVICQVIYACLIDLNGDGAYEILPPFDISSGSYPIMEGSDTESNVYLFYTPSEFTDRDNINIENNGVKVKLYIANQEETSVSKVNINKTEASGSVTEIYTNLSSVQRRNYLLDDDHSYLYSKAELKDRIFDITISVYKDGAIAKGDLSDPLITLSSAKEE